VLLVKFEPLADARPNEFQRTYTPWFAPRPAPLLPLPPLLDYEHARERARLIHHHRRLLGVVFPTYPFLRGGAPHRRLIEVEFAKSWRWCQFLQEDFQRHNASMDLFNSRRLFGLFFKANPLIWTKERELRKCSSCGIVRGSRHSVLKRCTHCYQRNHNAVWYCNNDCKRADLHSHLQICEWIRCWLLLVSS
jgi:hypothetical protein